MWSYNGSKFLKIGQKFLDMVTNERDVKICYKNIWVSAGFLRKERSWASDVFLRAFESLENFQPGNSCEKDSYEKLTVNVQRGCVCVAESSERGRNILRVPCFQFFWNNLGKGSVRSYHLFCIRSGTHAFRTQWPINDYLRPTRIRYFQQLMPIHNFLLNHLGIM